MKSGVCPKCKSPNVHEGSNVPWKKGAQSQYALKISAASSVALDYYVCVDCGCIESYVASNSDMDAISKKWPRVSPEQAI